MTKKSKNNVNENLDPNKKIIKDIIGDYRWDDFFIDKNGKISNGTFIYNEDLVKDGPNLYEEFIKIFKNTIHSSLYTEKDIIGFELERDYNYDDPDDYILKLKVVRLETQEEVDNRIKSEELRLKREEEAKIKKEKAFQALAEKKKELDYQTYLKLKKRYEQ